MQRNGDEDAVDLARRMRMVAMLAVQQEVFLRSQALAAGIPRQRIDYMTRTGRWSLVLPGVLTTGSPADPVIRIRAAALWAGQGSVIGGRAALFCAGLISKVVGPVDVFVPPPRRRREPNGVRVIRAAVERGDFTVRDGIFMTTVERSCLDLARWGHRNDYLDLALRRRFTTVHELRKSLNRSARRRGQVLARRAASDVAKNPWSPLERDFHQCLRDAGIDGWVANSRVTEVPGTVHPDVAFEDIMLAIEIDGRRYHDEMTDPEAFERDHERQLALQRAGWTVLRFTRRQIEETPDLVIETIKMMIARLRLGAAR